MNAVNGAGDLEYLTYFSSAVERLSLSALKRVLDISRRNNAPRGVTGLLLYRDGRFLLYLEGPPGAARTTYEHIGMDERHHSLRVVGTGRLKGRIFPEWWMGYRNLAAYGPPAPRDIQSACSQLSARRMKVIRPSS
jgi:hypothetical protein